jgi:hypothetical protein
MFLLLTMASALKISPSLGTLFDSWSPLRFVTSEEYDINILTRSKIDAALVAKQADAVEKGKEQAKANFFKTSVYMLIRCLHRSFDHQIKEGRHGKCRRSSRAHGSYRWKRSTAPLGCLL